jgi:hypothetical protein
MYINGSGNVGIGTTNPGYLLDAEVNANIDGGAQIRNASTGTAAVAGWRVGNANGSNRGGIAILGSGYTSSGVYRQDGIYCFSAGAGGFTLAAQGAYPIYMCTNGSERMRIDSAGNVGIGVTNPSSALNFGTPIVNKIIALYDSARTAPASATDFYGFGINNSTLRYNTDSTGSVHKFYCGATLAATIGSSSVQSSNNPVWNLSKYSQANQSGVIVYSQTDYSRNVTIVLASGTVQVPVAGYYQLNFTYFIDAGQAGSGGTYFRVNGNKVATRNYSSEAQAYRPGHISAVVSLAANDILTIYSEIILHGNDNCNFSGHLIA